jgi:hypothetical protein
MCHYKEGQYDQKQNHLKHGSCFHDQRIQNTNINKCKLVFMVYSKNHKRFNKSHIKAMFIYILWLKKNSNWRLFLFSYLSNKHFKHYSSNCRQVFKEMFICLNGFMVRCIINSHNLECIPSRVIAHNIVLRLLNLMKVPHHWWVHGQTS